MKRLALSCCAAETVLSSLQHLPSSLCTFPSRCGPHKINSSSPMLLSFSIYNQKDRKWWQGHFLNGVKTSLTLCPPGLLHTVNYRIISCLGDQEAWPISALLGNQFVFMIRILCKTIKHHDLQLNTVQAMCTFLFVFLDTICISSRNILDGICLTLGEGL